MMGLLPDEWRRAMRIEKGFLDSLVGLEARSSFDSRKILTGHQDTFTVKLHW